MQSRCAPGNAVPDQTGSNEHVNEPCRLRETTFRSIDMPLREARDLFEKAYFEHHLRQAGGSMTKVAEKSGLERTHLYRKLKALGIDVGLYKGD